VNGSGLVASKRSRARRQSEMNAMTNRRDRAAPSVPPMIAGRLIRDGEDCGLVESVVCVGRPEIELGRGVDMLGFVTMSEEEEENVVSSG
jgi:hypothetical protein